LKVSLVLLGHFEGTLDLCLLR